MRTHEKDSSMEEMADHSPFPELSRTIMKTVVSGTVV